MKKICKKCSILKNLKEFVKNSNCVNGFENRCIQCYKIYLKKYTLENQEKISKQRKTHYQINKEYIKNKAKIYRDQNREKIKKFLKDYYKENKKELMVKAKVYVFNKRKQDPIYKLKMILRHRLNESLKRKSWKKNNSLKNYIGCSLEELKNHLEKQFKKGMSWENHTSDGWHIDHVIPLSSAKTEEELYKLCHYKNLQPLWAKENISKGAKWL